MQLVIDFYILSICVQLYMFRASIAHHQESLTVHTYIHTYIHILTAYLIIFSLRAVRIFQSPVLIDIILFQCILQAPKA
jgi:hypothetical protein